MLDPPACPAHSPAILGEGHEFNKNRTWWVIALCGLMMVAEIAGGLMFGSIALVADGLHMSTHAGALLLAALAYSFASRHATDARFTFGTGKLGDLAGFTSAIVLAMIALLIGYEAVSRLFAPVPINFSETIPIAALGLIVNVASVLLLSGGHHHHHGHAHDDDDDDEEHGQGDHATHRDNNMRAAIVHVMADAAVSLLVIAGLVLARLFGWMWLDPLAGILGAIMIAAWSYGLIRDTGAILLDMIPDRAMAHALQAAIESEGDELADFHLWRLGPGHLGAIFSIVTARNRGADFYRARLARFPSLAHVTIELAQKS